MKGVKTFFLALLAGFMLLGVSSAMAAGPKFFNDESSCQSALEKDAYSVYTPATNNPAPASWKRRLATADECKRGWTTQGWKWVVLPKNFEYAYDEVGKRWVMAKCQNPIDDQGNAPQEMVADTPMTFVAPACDGKCQAVKMCSEKGGSLQDLGANKWQCTLPSQQVQLIQPVEVRGEVRYVWQGWNDPGLQVPAATPQISVARSQAPVVNGTICQGCNLPPQRVIVPQQSMPSGGCQFDCKVRDVVGMQNIPSPNGQCEVRYKHTVTGQQGRILIDRNPHNPSYLRLAHVVNGQLVKNMGTPFPYSGQGGCDADQDQVKRKWTEVTQQLGLPGCVPTN